MEELMLNSEVMKQTLKDKGVHTPAIFVEKSKYFYMHEMKLSGEDIHKIEMFKQWYKYQLDTYLQSDWVVSFLKEADQVTDLEWRKVLKAIGLKADKIRALEINDVCDFATLNHRSKKWKISEPNNNSGSSEWNEMGLKENDARHIISFRHWHKFYVAGKKNKSKWAAEFNAAQYENFVQRYIDPSNLDVFKPSLWASKNDSLRLAKEKKE